jgi:hypothetical protein
MTEVLAAAALGLGIGVGLVIGAGAWRAIRRRLRDDGL